MEQIVVKTEMQPDEEILLFYVDEDGSNEHGVVTTIENIEQTHEAQLQDDGSYLVEQSSVQAEDDSVMEEEHAWAKDKWTDEETKKLLVFFIDNKATFLSGSTRKRHLWTVACKTMLSSKHPNSCEMKLRNLKRKYLQLRLEQDKGFNVMWPYYQLCHQAFHDDNFINTTLENEKAKAEQKPIVALPGSKPNEETGIVVVKKVNKHSGDGNVEAMLNLYLKNKNITQKTKQKALWQSIALQLGVEDGDYWQKRFLNFKNNYIRLLDKRNTEGPEGINWPYMHLFDQIYGDDEEFQKKHGPQKVVTAPNKNFNYQRASTESFDHIWNDTELTVLVKYYFDCYQEFHDKTIPNSFLWNEVGRLIDKKPDSCKAKYEELRKEHLGKYIEGGYELRTRVPLAILFDNIISKDVQQEISIKAKTPEHNLWKTDEIDELVQFFYDNNEIFKDPICYFVCWAAVAKKLKRSVSACRKQWKELTSLYKSILDDKKDNPDMQIDWRYIELFDCIFVYGMDTQLLEGYEQSQDQNKETEKIGVKKVVIKSDDENDPDEISEDEESYDERGFMKRTKRRTGDSKSFKILAFYQKNKDKFASPTRKKLALWEVLAREIGISASQCAHRFRNLKQVYTKYVQREISKPDKPILWPYYSNCKKVFGYRALKFKLRNGMKYTDDEEDWSAKEIKQLINYFAENFDDINSNLDDKTKWSALAAEIGKLEDACSDKLLELRKSYRKLKTMRTRNPDVKISWKYFNMLDELYKSKENVEIVQEIEMNGDAYQEISPNDIKMEAQDEDFQCIIVIPEGQDIGDMSNAQIIMPENGDMSNAQIIMPENGDMSNAQIIMTENVDMSNAQIIMSENGDMSNAQIIMPENGEVQPDLQVQTEKPVNKWTKKIKKTLLIHYINYLRMNKGKEINSYDMWKEISAKLGDKTPLSCRKMFAKLKSNHMQLANEGDSNKKKTPYYTLVEKIIAIKPKFAKAGQKKTLKESKVYKDVQIPDIKVQQALQYYLDHIEEFVSPKFENKYLWTELAKFISEPLNKIFNKISYLKQNFDVETGEVAGEKTGFTEVLKEIIAKESAFKNDIQNDPKPTTVEESQGEVDSWTDGETEQLLSWYLANLEKFKNPKFVRSYLWMEAADILKKSALVCSKKMTEIRTQYKILIKQSPEELNNWKFYDLCQKIYGTGKRNNSESIVMLETTQNV